MSFNKTWLFYTGIALVILYWIPAFFFPDVTNNIVNALFTIVSAALAVILIPDMWNLTITRGVGMSWQALMAKSGLFILTSSFSIARAWAFAASVADFPAWMLHSPIGTFFIYLMGIGLASILYGFESVGDLYPKITFQGALVTGVIIGIIVGLSLAQVRV